MQLHNARSLSVSLAFSNPLSLFHGGQASNGSTDFSHLKLVISRQVEFECRVSTQWQDVFCLHLFSCAWSECAEAFPRMIIQRLLVSLYLSSREDTKKPFILRSLNFRRSVTKTYGTYSCRKNILLKSELYGHALLIIK